MPRKSQDTPSAIRIRDNQRRSRVRRAEHLQALQQRVHQYEQQGVAATLEMQQAARKVAQDNVRLRALLALHGVENEEVEAFLRDPDVVSGMEGGGNCKGVEPERLQSRFDDSQHSGGSSQSVPDTLETQRQHPSDSSQPPTTIPQTKTSLLPDATSRPQNTTHHPNSGTSITDNKQSYPTTQSSECPTTLECFCPPPPVSEDTPTSSGLEISCEAAASIIAEMRGSGDNDGDSIRASLGCVGRETCTIKNSTVLQVMDEG